MTETSKYSLLEQFEQLPEEGKVELLNFCNYLLHKYEKSKKVFFSSGQHYHTTELQWPTGVAPLGLSLGFLKGLNFSYMSKILIVFDSIDLKDKSGLSTQFSPSEWEAMIENLVKTRGFSSNIVKSLIKGEEKKAPKAGFLKGNFVLSSDFDEPLEDFKEYME